MKQVNYRPQLSVASLPPATTALKGTIVNYNNLAYWCDGTSWAPLNGSANVLQVVTGTIGSLSGTTVLPINAVPTISSGVQIWSQAITITTGTRVLLKAQFFVDYSVSGKFVNLAFFRDSTFMGVLPIAVANSGSPNSASYMDYDMGMGSGLHTYSCRVGGSSAGGSWFVNQDKSGNKYGGGIANAYSLSEIQ